MQSEKCKVKNAEPASSVNVHLTAVDGMIGDAIAMRRELAGSADLELYSIVDGVILELTAARVRLQAIADRGLRSADLPEGKVLQFEEAYMINAQQTAVEAHV